jgi:hypothetical protein
LGYAIYLVLLQKIDKIKNENIFMWKLKSTMQYQRNDD